MNIVSEKDKIKGLYMLSFSVRYKVRGVGSMYEKSIDLGPHKDNRLASLSLFSLIIEYSNTHSIYSNFNYDLLDILKEQLGSKFVSKYKEGKDILFSDPIFDNLNLDRFSYNFPFIDSDDENERDFRNGRDVCVFDGFDFKITKLNFCDKCVDCECVDTSDFDENKIAFSKEFIHRHIDVYQEE